jgi:hypothetical protein
MRQLVRVSLELRRGRIDRFCELPVRRSGIGLASHSLQLDEVIDVGLRNQTAPPYMHWPWAQEACDGSFNESVPGS